MRLTDWEKDVEEGCGDVGANDVMVVGTHIPCHQMVSHTQHNQVVTLLCILLACTDAVEASHSASLYL